MARPTDATKVLRRIHLDPLLARKLDVAAATRGQTTSDFVEWALLPHLAFDLPELPDVEVRAIVVATPIAEADGRAGGARPGPLDPRRGCTRRVG